MNLRGISLSCFLYFLMIGRNVTRSQGVVLA